jgi:hypothetical protein
MAVLDRHKPARKQTARGKRGTAFGEHRDHPTAGTARSEARSELWRTGGASPKAHQPAQQALGQERSCRRAHREARAVHEPAHRGVTEAKRRGDLLVAVAVDRGTYERLALHARKGSELGERCVHRQAPIELAGGGDVDAAVHALVERHAVVAGAA